MNSKITKDSLTQLLLTNQFEYDGMSNIKQPFTWTSTSFDEKLERWTKVKRGTESNLRKHAANFLTWYCGFSLNQKDLEITILGIWSSIKVNEDDFFVSSLISDQGRELIPVVKDFTKTLEFSTTQRPILEDEKETNYATDDPYAEWMNKYLKILNNSESSEPEIQDALSLILFLSLEIVRLTAKEDEATIKHIMNGNNRLRNLIPLNDISLAIYPPSPHAVRFFQNWFRKGLPSSVNLLLPLIQIMRKSDKQHIKNLCTATWAMALAYVGLTVLGWFEKATKKLQISKGELIKYMAVEANLRFIENLALFRGNMGDKFASDMSWMYARLLDDSALTEFAVSNHQYTLSIFVALSGEDEAENSGVWTARSISSIPLIVRNQGKEDANCIMQLILDKKQINPLTDEAAEVQKMRKTMLQKREAKSFKIDDDELSDYEEDVKHY
nr:MAG: nucleoprotein [Rhabdoviridae sp.]